MTNIFIFYDNLDNLYLLKKYLSITNNIKLLGSSKSVTKEIINICNTLKPHIIICTSNVIDKLKNLLYFKYILITLDKNIPIVCHQLNNISSNTKYSHKLNIYNYKKAIYKELIKLNFNPNMIGTNYLLDCILCSHENPYSQLTHIQLSKYYRQIAYKYDTTINVISWNIQKSIENMYKNTSSKFRKKYFLTEEYLGCSSIINHFRFLY